MQADTAMPTQSAPQVSPTQPISYAAPVMQQTAAQAPAVATSPQWVASYQPTAAPAPQMPAQMGVTNYPSSPTASYPQAFQATPQAENPYKEAFNKVVGLLSSPVQFPFQGQQSNASQQTVPANYSSPVGQGLYSNQVTPTFTPGINSNPAYSSDYSQTSQEITADQLRANGVSDDSLQVIDYFGADAPAVLNNYACQIEDALITTNQQLAEAVGLLQELSQEHRSYETILTDPDILADYTCEFFGENGPYPIPDEEPAYGQQVGQQYVRPAGVAVPPGRPELPAPPQPQPQGNPSDFWRSFGTMADRDPANAWRYLNQAAANPEVFRQKMLVME